MTRARNRWLIVLLAVAVALGAASAYVVLQKSSPPVTTAKAVYYCPMHPTYTSDRPGDCPICNMKLIQRESPRPPAAQTVPTPSAERAVYSCPMHPAHTSDRPGDCPICNMKLTRRESSRPPAAQAAADICYMHDCPMIKEGQSCPMMVVAKAGEKISCPACGEHVAEGTPADVSKKVLYWTDPMIPGYKADKPGQSPMGMDLVPVYEDHSGHETKPSASPEGYSPILVTPQKRQLIGVRTAKVETRALSKTIRTVGRIAYDPELYQAEQEYISSIRAWKEAEKSTDPDAAAHAKRLVESGQMRLRLLGLSQELIDEVAGWSGPDKSLLLADPAGKVWLYAPVYEYELPWVKVGQTVTMETSAAGGKKLAGTIRAIDSVLDPVTRTARVRAELTDPDGNLKPEMYVNVSIAVRSGKVLAMPEGAVFNTGQKRIVFVDKTDGIFEPRDVRVGFKADGYYELISGAAEGESVVTSGNFLIDSESRLKAALDGMGDGAGHSHG